jgi:hypothetical protein
MGQFSKFSTTDYLAASFRDADNLTDLQINAVHDAILNSVAEC